MRVFIGVEGRGKFTVVKAQEQDINKKSFLWIPVRMYCGRRIAALCYLVGCDILYWLVI